MVAAPTVREAFGMTFECPPGYLDTPSIGVPPRLAADALGDAVRSGGSVLPGPPISTLRSRWPGVRSPPYAGLTPLASPSAEACPRWWASWLAPSLTERGCYGVGRVHQREFPVCGAGLPGRRHQRVSVGLIPERASDYDIVAVSAVQSRDGTLLDLARLREAVRGSPTRVIVDVTQAAGWLPLRLDWADAIVCTGYKWLLSPRGAAWMAVRRDYAEKLVATSANWYAAQSRWTPSTGCRCARRTTTAGLIPRPRGSATWARPRSYLNWPHLIPRNSKRIAPGSRMRSVRNSAFLRRARPSCRSMPRTGQSA